MIAARMLTVVLLLIGTAAASAEDWPQWLGPKRDSVWRESGIVQSIPESGLPVKWRVPVGYGYSGPAVAGGKVFVPDYQLDSGRFFNSPGGVAELQGTERLVCLDERSGDVLWTYAYDQPYKLSYPGGPRSTPTVDGDRVYFLGAEGRLSCLNAANGDVIWSKTLNQEYNTKTPIWGHSSHPLIVGDLLTLIVGGPGSIAVAFDKRTGKEVWKALSGDEQGYSSPTLIEHAGVEQLLIWEPKNLHALNPQTGAVYWSLPFEPAFSMSVTVPRQEGNRLYVSGIGSVGGVIQLDDAQPGAKLLWKGNTRSAIYCCNSTPFIENGVVYGNDIDTSALIAADLSDGKRLWQTMHPTLGEVVGNPRHGTVFLVKHEDRFFLFNEKGDLILARLTPEKYEELGRFHVLAPTNEAFQREVVWSHPAFANRCVYARNDKEIVCVDLSAK